MLEALSKSVLLFLIAPILVELRPTKKLRQNMLDRGSIFTRSSTSTILSIIIIICNYITTSSTKKLKRLINIKHKVVIVIYLDILTL